MPPLTIGLTGGIAAGKSEALAAFERLGAATISSDAVVHELLDSEPLLGAADRALGRRCGAGRHGSIAAGSARSSSPTRRAGVAGVADPPAGGRADRRLAGLAAAGDRIAVVEVPLLFESEMEAVFDTTVAVVTADEVRRARAEARGHALVGEREARQLAQEEKAARAEHVIENDGSLEDLERALSALVEKLEG